MINSIPGVKNDGGQQFERHATATNCGQDNRFRGQGWGWQDLVWRVLFGCWQYGYTQEDGCRCLEAGEAGLDSKTELSA